VTHVETETSALVKAVKKNDVKAVKALLQQGADPNDKDSIDRPALGLAVERGYTTIVKALVERKADVNAKDEQGTSPLFLTDDVSIINILLDAGADVNIFHPVFVANGVTRLMMAAETGNSDVLTLLLKRGAKVDAKGEDGTTALMAAAMAGELNCLKILLKNGAKVNAKDDFGMTALQRANWDKAKPEILKLLKDAGAKE
jgi:ankyrin repeat protein